MSLTITQIKTLIDMNCKSNSVSFPEEEKLLEINLALDEVTSLISQSSGTWQYDDSNHTDYPTITTALTTGQRDYPFTTDEQGNLILDIYKVMVKSSANGRYEELYPVDMQSDSLTESFYDGVNTSGKPSSYDKTANGIIFNCLPDETVANGVKVFINREGSYFTTADTTKKPGFAGLYHEYLALVPSYKYAMRNGLDNKNDLKNEIINMQSQIKQSYRDRARDEQARISSETINSI